MTIADAIPALPADGAVFLDFDGTLVDIAPTPDQVVVSPALTEVLRALVARHAGAVAIVSGRAIADLDRLLAPLRLPSAGLHGLERRRADGSRERRAAPRWVARAAAELEPLVRRHPGVRVENKRVTIAVHYRGAPAAEPAVIAAVEACGHAHRPHAVLQRGKMVVELKPRGRDKGTAITAFMREPPFAGRVPVFLGDDVTDEHGFDAVNRLHGLSVRIGAPAESVAMWRLPTVSAALAWLAQDLSVPGT